MSQHLQLDGLPVELLEGAHRVLAAERAYGGRHAALDDVLERDVVCVPEWSLAVVGAGDVDVWVDPAGVDDLPCGVDDLALVSAGRLEVLPDGGDLVPGDEDVRPSPASPGRRRRRRQSA